MKRGGRRILAVTGVLSIGLAVAVVWFLAQAMPIGTGYVAKYLCTSTFPSKRDPQVVFAEDIKPVNPLAKLVSWDIDTVGQSVTATAFKVFRSKAIFPQGCGCTLLAGATEASLREQTFFKAGAGLPPPSHPPAVPWPKGSAGAVDPATDCGPVTPWMPMPPKGFRSRRSS
ncbi:hypothetical protein [Desulfosarcina sp.]|uniref:hypothetical protein n=1 Tax=Desulfosarcina sp. TaxID=2027861 RepID=UPI003561303C